MKRSAPMKRSAWPSKGIAALRQPEEREKNRELRRLVDMMPLARPANYGGATTGPLPKTVEHRCPALLELARGERCLLRVPGVCNGRMDTTVACHSNFSEHGKAGARKADDHWTVWGCSACHAWLDQGPAPIEEKRERFLAAHVDQHGIWMEMAYDPYQQGGATPRERKAAQWAVDRISEERMP